MPFKKGQSGNLNGRPSDPNVKLLRETVRGKLADENRMKKLFEHLDDLEGRDYIDCFLKIFKEVMPALAAEVNVEEENKRVESIFETYFEKMSKKVG